jgi:hypothetical protein
MIWLAFLIATWAVFGAGRQLGHDARAGITTARQRAAVRSAAIRADKGAPRWKRRTYTAAHYGGKLSGATLRGARYAGRSAWTGAKWGVAEGRARYAERTELREAKPLSDGDDRMAYRQTRDRILHDRAERRGTGVPERKVRRIAKRDAAEDERLAGAEPVSPAVADEPEPEPGCDGLCTSSEVDPAEAERQGLCATCGHFGDEHGHFPCRDCGSDKPRSTRPRVDRPAEVPAPRTERAPLAPPCAGCRAGDDCYRSITDPYQCDTSELDGHDYNGGTTMTAPTGNGFRASGEATTISGARAAWASFEGYAVEALDTAGAAEQEAKQLQAMAAGMFDAASAAETDAKQMQQAAASLAASLADGDMGDPQAVADAEQQQAVAADLSSVAQELRADGEATQAAAANRMGIAQKLRSLAETAQTHAAAALRGMNERNARREVFFKD